MKNEHILLTFSYGINITEKSEVPAQGGVCPGTALFSLAPLFDYGGKSAYYSRISISRS